MKGKNFQLEVIRGLACIMVLCGHIYTKTAGFPQFSLLNYLFNWGTESVIIFFILSGFVIRISQERKSRSFGQFIINRFIRIYPLYLIAVLLAYSVARLYLEEVSLMQILGNLCFLQTIQGYIVETISTNQSLWSLSYEIFFYLAFAISLVYPRTLKIWIFLSLMCWIFYNVSFSLNLLNHFKSLFAFSLIWLFGYGIAIYRDSFKFEKSFAFSLIPLAITFSRIHFIDNYYDIYRLTGFALLFLPLFNILTSSSKKIFKIKKSIVLGILIFVLLLLWTLSNSNLITKIIFSFTSVLGIIFSYYFEFNYKFSYGKQIFIYIASISYALYIMHMPILYGLQYLIPEKPLLIGFLTVLITFIFAHIFELIIQPKIAGNFKKIMYNFKLSYSKS